MIFHKFLQGPGDSKIMDLKILGKEWDTQKQVVLPANAGVNSENLGLLNLSSIFLTPFT